MALFAVALSLLIGIAYGANCPAWNGSPIASGSVIRIYHPTLKFWLNWGTIPPNSFNALLLKPTGADFVFQNVESWGSGFVGDLYGSTGLLFNSNYGGNWVTTNAGQQLAAFAIVPNGAAPNVLLRRKIRDPRASGTLLGTQLFNGVVPCAEGDLTEYQLFVCSPVPTPTPPLVAVPCQYGAVAVGSQECSCPYVGVSTYFNYWCDYPYAPLPNGGQHNAGVVTSFTQSAIIKLTSAGGTGRIFDKITAGYADGWLLDVINGNFRIILGNNAFTYGPTPAVPYNKFVFVTMSYNSDSGWGHLYLNGQWYNSYYSPNLPSNGQYWRVGKASDGSNVFPGSIDRARLYWVLLSNNDIYLDFVRAKYEYPLYYDLQ